MKAYNFELENVLEWRTDIEKEVIDKFAIVQRELESQKEILNNLILEHKKAVNNKRYNNIYQLQQQHLYIENLEDKMEVKEIQIKETKDKLELTRKDLLEAQKDRKVMEKLKERDLEEYLNNKKMAEQKELDEIAILKYQNTTA